MLYKLFEDMQSKPRKFLQVSNGADFERLLINKLFRHGITELSKDAFKKEIGKTLFKDIKTFVLDKNESRYFKNCLKNKDLINKLIYQPFGKQQYPDFLFIMKKYIIPIEIKYSSKSNSAMWNSNLPKSNGFYVFASYEKADVTFFLGSDVLDSKTRKKLNDFFIKPIELLKEFIASDMTALKSKGVNLFGFKPYIRKAFDASKTFSTSNNKSIFKRPNREDSEKNFIKKIKEFG